MCWGDVHVRTSLLHGGASGCAKGSFTLTTAQGIFLGISHRSRRPLQRRVSDPNQKGEREALPTPYTEEGVQPA